MFAATQHPRNKPPPRCAAEHVETMRGGVCIRTASGGKFAGKSGKLVVFHCRRELPNERNTIPMNFPRRKIARCYVRVCVGGWIGVGNLFVPVAVVQSSKTDFSLRLILHVVDAFLLRFYLCRGGKLYFCPSWEWFLKIVCKQYSFYVKKCVQF